MNNALMALVLMAATGASAGEALPDWRSSDESLFEARKEFAKSDAELLFLLMVNRQGDVVKVKLLKSKLDNDRSAMMFRKHLYSAKFKVAKPQEPDYREFLYPMDIKTSVEY